MVASEFFTLGVCDHSSLDRSVEATWSVKRRNKHKVVILFLWLWMYIFL